MFFLRKLLSGTIPSAVTGFLEEDLLSTTAQGNGFFLTKPGAFLKAHRYEIIRKLGRGRCSNTFLVKDHEANEFLAAKILSADSTIALQHGFIHELDVLQAVAESAQGSPQPLLPILRDHFAQRGPHGVHYCILTDPLRSDVHTFRGSAPTGKLAVHIVKPIIACAVEGVKYLHSRNIIHADIKSDNLLFLGPDAAEIQETIQRVPPQVEGTFDFLGTQYPILRSQPFRPKISWDASPFIAETIQVVLSDLGAALWADKPKPSGDIGAIALRAPENVIRAECGKEIDIWAIGCMTYELLTGQILFQPQTFADLTADESLLLLQYTLTGETLDKKLVQQSRVKNQYFDLDGNFVKAKLNPYTRQTLEELLSQHTDLTANQLKAAACFIKDCLRLNPGDRLNVEQLEIHSWLETAFMGCADVPVSDQHSAL